jgi:hypothetical protein
MNWMQRTAWTILAGFALAGSSCAPGPTVVEAASDPAPVIAVTTPSQKIEAKVEKAADRGATLAKEILTPSEPGRHRIDVTSSPQRKLASDLPEPAILPPSTLPPPQPPLDRTGRPARPALLDEPAPLFDQLTSPRLPEPPHFAVGPRVRASSSDVNQPIPLPFLGQPVQGRATLEDPTLGASLAMALALSPPLRMSPAPFLRQFLPDPFEHRDSGRLRNPPEEDHTPVTATPRVPGK